MSYTVEPITAALKAAREAEGLSQRDLSEKSGLPQSQISRIEAGVVDLRLSSLVALARVLGLELTLVPRKTVPAIQSVVRMGARSTLEDDEISIEGQKELRRIEKTIASIAQTDTFHVASETAQIKRLLQDIRFFHFTVPGITVLGGIHNYIKKFKNNPKDVEFLRLALAQLQNLRNATAHRSTQPTPPRPAYSLDEDSDG